MSVATPLARATVRSTTTISRHIPPRSINDSTVAAPTAPTPTTPTFTIPPPWCDRHHDVSRAPPSESKGVGPADNTGKSVIGYVLAARPPGRGGGARKAGRDDAYGWRC